MTEVTIEPIECGTKLAVCSASEATKVPIGGDRSMSSAGPACREYSEGAVIGRVGKPFRVRVGNVWMPRNLHRRGGHERLDGMTEGLPHRGRAFRHFASPADGQLELALRSGRWVRACSRGSSACGDGLRVGV